VYGRAREVPCRSMATTAADVAEGVAAFLERRRPNFQGV
jgi:enoyl-CoA hydratase/carnithine racemase